jgi:uncharacterized LabA/DUF88 family protein
LPAEPDVKRTCVFIDGQNLFWAARHAFGYHFPNYDPLALARIVTQPRGWTLDTVHFYTGIPDIQDNDTWNKFWTAKLAVMGSRGIVTYARHLKYRNQTIRLPDGTSTTILVGQEKGIDIRIALDVVRMARQNLLDIALIFSQDQDLSEVVDEVRQISIQQNRWIKVACAFPVSPTSINKRGINDTDWIPIDRKTYDACLDKNDYRPK